MFVVDDILMAPARGLFWIFREIHQAAQEELVTDAESITAELSASHQTGNGEAHRGRVCGRREASLLETGTR